MMLFILCWFIGCAIEDEINKLVYLIHFVILGKRNTSTLNSVSFCHSLLLQFYFIMKIQIFIATIFLFCLSLVQQSAPHSERKFPNRNHDAKSSHRSQEVSNHSFQRFLTSSKVSKVRQGDFYSRRTKTHSLRIHFEPTHVWRRTRHPLITTLVRLEQVLSLAPHQLINFIAFNSMKVLRCIFCFCFSFKYLLIG